MVVVVLVRPLISQALQPCVWCVGGDGGVVVVVVVVVVVAYNFDR